MGFDPDMIHRLETTRTSTDAAYTPPLEGLSIIRVQQLGHSQQIQSSNAALQSIHYLRSSSSSLQSTTTHPNRSASLIVLLPFVSKSFNNFISSNWRNPTQPKFASELQSYRSFPPPYSPPPFEKVVWPPVKMRVDLRMQEAPFSTLLFFRYNNYHYMTNVKKLWLLSVLFAVSLSAPQYYSDNSLAFSSQKGLTFEATIWPQQSNSYVGRMSCNNCNPTSGDVSCTVELPITCIINSYKLDRPFYSFYPTFTPYNNPDQSFFQGWSGGVIALTDPVKGLQITSVVTGTKLCQNYFGRDAIMATFESGFYMPYMNGPTLALEKTWDWGKAKRGQYNFWGYFNHNHIGRSWVWSTLGGNCVVPNANSLTPKP